MEISRSRRRVPISRQKAIAAVKEHECIFRNQLKEINELENKVQSENYKPSPKEQTFINKKRRVMMAIESVDELYNGLPTASRRQQRPSAVVSLEDSFLAASSAKHAVDSTSKAIDRLTDALTVFRKTLTSMTAVHGGRQIYGKPASLAGYSDGDDVDGAPRGR